MAAHCNKKHEIISGHKVTPSARSLGVSDTTAREETLKVRRDFDCKKILNAARGSGQGIDVLPTPKAGNSDLKYLYVTPFI